jgi:hypothetical protein
VGEAEGVEGGVEEAEEEVEVRLRGLKTALNGFRGGKLRVRIWRKSRNISEYESRRCKVGNSRWSR